MSLAPNSSALTVEGTSAYRRQVEEAASALPSIDSSPAVGILHDTALAPLLDEATTEATRPCADIPHLPTAEGTLTTGVLDGTPVVELEQQMHLYDGHTPREVTFPVRMLATAGVDTLFLTAPAGSVAPQFERGTLMLVTDHINFQGQNPLVGPNVDDWGPRFPDMTEPYDPSLRRMAETVARNEGVSLRKGIYMALLGPNEETAAEHRMTRRLGADAVGTTVIPEVIAARHMDLRVMAVTLLTEQYPTGEVPPASTEAPPSLDPARSKLHRLLTEIVVELGSDAPTP
ncbi:MAG: purine-nucleoside phosphorylase [Salinibacter sp.]